MSLFIRNAIIRHQGQEPSEDVLAVYCKLVGTRTDHSMKDVGELDFNSGMKKLFTALVFPRCVKGSFIIQPRFSVKEKVIQ